MWMLPVVEQMCLGTWNLAVLALMQGCNQLPACYTNFDMQLEMQTVGRGKVVGTCWLRARMSLYGIRGHPVDKGMGLGNA